MRGFLRVSTRKRQRDKDKIRIVSYADDFVVTAANEQSLRDNVFPILVKALKEVGLELSSEKTRITSIDKGFDFLGFNLRKYPCGKLLIKPSKANIKVFLEEIKRIIQSSGALPTEILIHRLNQKITGWTNYYRGVVSSKVFATIDEEIFKALKRWQWISVRATKLNLTNFDHNFLWPGLKTMQISVGRKD